MRFEMKDPLGEGQWEAIEGAGLGILEETGFEVEHGEVLEALSGKRGYDGAKRSGGGSSRDGGRLPWGRRRSLVGWEGQQS